MKTFHEPTLVTCTATITMHMNLRMLHTELHAEIALSGVNMDKFVKRGLIHAFNFRL